MRRVDAEALTAVAVAIVLDWSLAWRLEVAGVRPDFLLVAAALVGLRQGPWRGAAWGLAAGLVADLAVGRLVGLPALWKGLAGWAGGRFARNFYEENLLGPAAVLPPLAFAQTVSVGLAVGWLAHLPGDPWALLPLGLHAAVYETLVGSAIHVLWPRSGRPARPGHAGQFSVPPGF
ncbi:MAG: rod shape-determining protein MreD [Clostridia bacterium]|nr:rod shape-determining protein MreD [Clostridia bacterium]